MRIPAARIEVGRRPQSVRIHDAAAAGDPSHPGHEAVVHLQELQRREAERQARGRALDALSATIDNRIAELRTQLDGNLDHVAAVVVELGLTVAREVVGSALDRGLVDIVPTVRRCLDAAVVGTKSNGGPSVSLQMHPEDLQVWASDAGLSRPDVQVDVGTNLQRGEVVISTGAGALHYEPMEVLERVSEAVRAEAFGQNPLVGDDEAPQVGDE